jgi:hypothetical protein
MTRFLFLLPLLALPAATAQDTADPKKPQWSPQGLSVLKPGPSDEEPGLLLNEGTHVTALLRLPGQFLIGIDTLQSKVEAFTDDKNTDLRNAPGANPLSQRLGVTTSRDPADGKYARIIFRAPGCPAAGATKVRVKGSLTALVGKDEKKVEKKDVSLKDGVELEIGTLKLLTPATRTTAVSYTGTRALKSVVFLDADGAEIPVRQSVGILSQRAARGQFASSFRPADRNTKLDRCTVRVTYFDRVDEVVVPVDLEVGPGL